MTNTMPRALIAALAALCCCGSAQAVTNWSLTGSSTFNGSYNNTRSFNGTGDGGTVQATAWSNTKNSPSSTSAYLESAYLARYGGGLGVRNQDSINTSGSVGTGDNTEGSAPNHSLDNENRNDSILFDFGAGKSMKLTSLTVGWWSGDSDIFVLAYTGTGVPDFTSTDVAYSSLLTSGWKVVQASGSANYSNAANGGVAASSNASTFKALTTINDLNISARFWLIGAVNTAIDSRGVDGSLDYVKIAALGGTYTKVAEPGTLALTLGALVSGVWLRRRKG